MAHIHLSPSVTADIDLPLLNLRLKKECQVLGRQAALMKYLHLRHLGSKLWGNVSSVLKEMILDLGIRIWNLCHF